VNVWLWQASCMFACGISTAIELALESCRNKQNLKHLSLCHTHAPILALLRHDFPLLLVIAFLFQQNTKYANTRSVLDTGQQMRNHHRNFISSALDTGTEWRCTLSSRGTCRHTLSTPGLAGALPMYTHLNTYQTRTKNKFMCVAYECLQLVRWCIWFDVYIVQRVIWCLNAGIDARRMRVKLHQHTNLVAAVFSCAASVFTLRNELVMPATWYS
jgi:hypothetical protein